MIQKPTIFFKLVSVLVTAFLTFTPLAPINMVVAEEPVLTEEQCVSIVAGETPLLEIPQQCWDYIEVDEPFCTELNSEENEEIAELAPMQEYFSASCLDVFQEEQTTSENTDTQLQEEPCTECGTSEVNTEQNAQVDNNVTTESNTGENTIEDSDGVTSLETGEATSVVQVENTVNTNLVTITDPLDAEDDIVEPTNTNNCEPENPCEDQSTPDTVETDQEASIHNNIKSDANSGKNKIKESDDDATIETSDATALANVVNVVNTNVTSSDAAELLIDVGDQFIGEINLLNILLDLIGGGAGFLSTITNQLGTIDNNIDVTANTGENEINDTDGNATIQTGKAFAALNLVNIVNTTVEGSSIFVAFINILGNWVGDLIVPGQGVLPYGSNSTQTSVESENETTVTNNVILESDSGTNETNGTESAETTTGNAIALASIYNLLNTTIINDDLLLILPNIFGVWEGGVVDSPTNDLGYGVGLENAQAGITTIESNVNQSASITNTILISAKSGKNKLIDADGTGSVITGDTIATANIINVANTHLVGSNWSFAVLNLFGNWKGNIVFAYPDLGITNDAGDYPAEGVVTPGQEVTYALHFENTGKAPAFNVTIQDSYPKEATFVSASEGGQEKDGVVTWTIPKLEPGSGLQSVTFTVFVPNDAVAPGEETTITNEVAIATQTNELNLDNNTAGSTLTVRAQASRATEGQVEQQATSKKALLQLTKTNDATSAKAPGESVNYEVVAASVGDADITNLVLVDELKDASGTVQFSKTWNFDVVEAGMNVTMMYTLVFPDDAQAGVYTNTVTATADNIEQATASSSMTVELKASEPSPEELAPAPTEETPTKQKRVRQPKPLLVIEKINNAISELKPGSTVSYTVTVANDGNETIKGVKATDILTHEDKSLPPLENKDWDFGDMRPGELITVSYDVQFDSNAPPGIYTNTFHVTGLSAKTSTPIDETATSEVKLKSDTSTIIDQAKGVVLGALTELGLNPPDAQAKTSEGTLIPSTPEEGLRMLIPWWIAVLVLGMLAALNYIIYKRKTLKKAKK